ncbi:hypothetical protein C6Y44_20510 [Rhodococcus rhodochrous]|nr:hypothetical protein C6Y44_20510 [Rhodococcus rhodochrous]
MRRRLSDEEIAAQRRKRRRVQIGCGVGALVVFGFIGLLAYEGLQAKSNLEKAQNFATQAKDALLAGDIDRAQTVAGDADRYAQNAQRSVDSAPWRMVSAVPLLGSPFNSVRQMTTIVSDITDRVLLPAVDAGNAVSPNQLILDGARINLAALRDAAPLLESTAAAAADLNARAQSVDSTYIGLIDNARVDLQNQVSELTGLLSNTSMAAKIGPAMLGADGPRSYFVGFQTNAEARGTGGLLGGYGTIRANAGAIEIDDLTTTQNLLEGEYEPIDLGRDFTQRYGHSRPTTFFGNSNVSPHFPYAAQIWQSIWRQESGDNVDGVIATDPVALSYVLGAIGPVTLPDGEKITATNVVELTESTAYTRFAGDNTARKRYLQTVAQTVAARMTSEVQNPAGLLSALARAASEGRLAVWSSHADEQAVLETTKLGHIVPDDEAPYAGVVVNNLAGNKMDYYLKRAIHYTAGACVGETRSSIVRVSLNNSAPNGDLPRYVAGAYSSSLNVQPGENLTDLSLLATHGAELEKVTVNGTSIFASRGQERGHPVFSLQFRIPPSETAEVVFELSEPTAPGVARVPVQPLVDDPEVVVDVPNCEG